MHTARFLSLALLALLSQSVFAQRDLKDIPDPDPELERKTFVVADGLEVNLFAADPLMAKPIQMNFDERGRLWIASSEVYPHIKPGEKANDKILVLEDTDGDGKADKTTVFAYGLLIPTGVIPGDGGAYVVNSTELLHLKDTDGDGKADERRIVLSGFGTEDTHHLLHTLRWGHDGRLYMNQSIYIHSHVETPYGVKRLNGGGIWRFRPESMELDVLCYGFVNPWGHHFDAWGQSFATDGAYHEGINYVFPGSVFITAPGENRFVSGLNPGSPKHCGLEIVSGRHMPPDWDGNMITNDFRAHRVCRFVVTEDQSGYASRQEVEVIKSSHIAFRPIDAKMGPGGELYIADWYNPIIQHGEVDFRDPRRDHVHGRIWRVTAKNRPLTKLPDFAAASDLELLEMLKQPEEWVRLHAKLTLKQRVLNEPERTSKLLETVRSWLAGLDPNDSTAEHHRIEALWLYQNIGHVEPELLNRLLKSTDHRVRAAAVRVATEWQNDLPNAFEIYRSAVSDSHPRVRLEGVRALADVPSVDAASAAIRALDQPMDRFLDFALWRTMRDLEGHWLPAVTQGSSQLSDNIDHVLYALKAIDSPAVVVPLLTLLRQGRISPERLNPVLSMIASLGGAKELGVVYELVLETSSDLSADARAALLDNLVESTKARKTQPAGDLARLGQLFESEHIGLRAAAIRAAGSWRVQGLAGTIAQQAANRTANAAVREAAIEAMASLGSSSVGVLTQLAGATEDFSVRNQAVNALATIAPAKAAELSVGLLRDLPAGVDPSTVVRNLLAQRAGPAAFTRSLAGQTLPADVAKLTLRAVQNSPQPSPELIEALRKAGRLEESAWKLTPELMRELLSEVAQRGDARRGEDIYRRAELQCTKCHAIAGAGGRVGPDLVSVGASAPPDYLIESLLAPSAKIKENFHSKVIATDDGRVMTGIVIRESKSEIVLRDAEDREVAIPVASIEEKSDGRSLMPDGAADQLTRSELVDLVRFLSELGKVNGDFAVGNARLVRRWETLSWTQEAHQRINRTSHDLVATGDPAFIWQPAYSKVSGELPLQGLPRFKPHQDTDLTSFVRCQIEVTTGGNVKLQLNDVTGLALWLNGKPQPVEQVLAFNLPRGTHTLVWDVNQVKRKAPLRIELLESEAQAQIVSGK